MAAFEDGERTTCAGGICALPPQAAALPAHVMRMFDRLFGDQRVIFRKQEIAARPERMAMRSWIDRERISGWRRMSPRASGASSEAEVSCVVGVLRHRWPQNRGARKRSRRREASDVGFGRLETVPVLGQIEMGSDPISSRGRINSVQRFLQLPALVRPRPVGGCGANLRFDHARVTRREFTGRQLLARRRDPARTPLRSGRARRAL